MLTACKGSKCINNVDTAWTYCPYCGRNQTSEVRKEGITANTLPFSSNELPSAPKGEESGVIGLSVGNNVIGLSVGRIRAADNNMKEMAKQHTVTNDELMRCLDTKPAMKPFRAWVAWHPDPYKVWDIALSRGSCEIRITRCRQDDFSTYEEFVSCHESELNTLRNDGWIIQQVEVKPVEGE